MNKTQIRLIKKHSPLLLTIVLVMLLIFAYFFIDSFKSFIHSAWQVLKSEDQEQIIRYFSAFGFWGPLALISFMVLQMFLIIFPSWLPMIVAVMAYGFLPGALISIAGVFLASSLGYFIGKNLNETALSEFISEKAYKKADHWVSCYGFWAVVLFRISPFLSNDAISFIAGVLNMSYRKFIMATLTGITPLAFAIAYFVDDMTTLRAGMYWIGGLGLLSYAVFIYIDYKRSIT